MNRLRNRLILIFLAATLAPWAATLWITTSLLERSLSYRSTRDLDEISKWSSFAALEERFHQRHQLSFGYHDDSGATEIVNVRLVSIGAMARPELPVFPFEGTDASGALKEHRNVYFRGRWHDVNIYERNRLRCGNQLTGPAVVEQLDSTTFF